MKFFALAVLLISYQSYACSNKIDESKIMLFVDANYSDLEIETASKAACQRGEKILVVPKNYKEHTAEIKKAEAIVSRIDSCKSNCDALRAEYRQVRSQIETMRTKEGSINDLIDKELADIQKKKGKVTNFIISGHDGGGHFGGYKGNITRDSIQKLMNKYKDINDVSTLMLLGCYTGVQKEILNWKETFPKVKMIGGYDGSAPLSDRPLGHQYLGDLLVKEKSLLAQANEKMLNQFVKTSIRGLGSMHTAVYVELPCDCKEDEINPFYYGSTSKRNFSAFKAGQCAKDEPKIKELYEKFTKFFTGEIEPPKNPSDPAIKTLYDEARSLEHCIDVLAIPNFVNSLFNLRFYEAVKENFSNFYKKELKTAELEISKLNAGSWDDIFKIEMAKIALEEKEYALEIDQISKNPQAYFKQLDKKIHEESMALKKITDDPSKVEIINKISLERNYRPSAQEKALFENYTKLTISIETNESKSDYKNEAKELIDNLKEIPQYQRLMLMESKESFDKLISKKIWLPTHENLKKYSRIDFANNLHETTALLGNEFLPTPIRSALTWAAAAQEQHLMHFQNPFEWHEVTPTITRPQQVISIQ